MGNISVELPDLSVSNGCIRPVTTTIGTFCSTVSLSYSEGFRKGMQSPVKYSGIMWFLPHIWNLTECTGIPGVMMTEWVPFALSHS